MGVPAPALSGGLLLIGVVCGGPGSVLFARARWAARSPTSALVLWQALCLCSGLSATAGVLVLGLEPVGGSLVEAGVTTLGRLAEGRPFAGLPVWRVALVLLAAAFAGYLLVVLTLTTLRRTVQVRRHRDALDLVAGGDRDDRRIRVLDEAAPLAWTVPGLRTRLVLTAGLLDLLDDAELRAVLAHERAHLSVRHDLLLLPFRAWAAALPNAGMRAAQSAVGRLTEMQADDAAARQVGGGVVASALATVALAAQPDRGHAGISADWGGTSSSEVAERVRRLRCPRPLPPAAVALVLLASALLLAVPAVALFLPWR